MAKRERRQPDPGEFEDPLSNYDPRQFEDQLEHSLSDDKVTAIEHRPFLAVLAGETVRATVDMMAEHNIACVVVVNEQAEPVGIFSERDVMTRVAGQWPQVVDKPMSEVMTATPAVVYSSETPARVLNVMVSGGFRHVPVVDADGKLMGMIGARRLTTYLQSYFPDSTGY
jgi:CBS domain-containing protein